MTNPHRGSSFDNFHHDAGMYEAASATAAIRVLAWQLKNEIESQGISKAELAWRMGTSRSQVDRLLNADESGIKLSTLERAARAVNRSLIVELQ